MAKASSAKPARVTTDIVAFKAGNAKTALAEAGATNGKISIVPIDKLRIAPGFNVRVTDTPAYAQKIEDLKKSILTEGFYPTKPLSGFIGKDGDADVIYVTDGHGRLEATKLANEAGAEITSLPVVMKPADTSDVDLTVALWKENTGAPLTMAETAVIVKRLLKAGLTPEQVSDRLGFSHKYVQDLIVLIGASRIIRDLVKRDKISGYEAVVQIRKASKADTAEYTDAEGTLRKGKPGRADGAAEAAIVKMVKNAEERGAAKASKKDSDEGTTKSGKKATKEGTVEAPLRMARHKTEWAVSKGQEFDLKEIRHFKNLVGDSDWYSLLGDKQGFAVATEDFNFKSVITRPKKAEPEAEPAPEKKLTKKERAAAEAEAASIAAAKTDDDENWGEDASAAEAEEPAEGELVDAAEGL